MRFERLADRVHKPKQITNYKVALAELTDWDADVKELAKLEGQALSALTKRTTLKNMIPEDLQHDLEKDRTLKSFEAAWSYVLEQVPLRKEWKFVKGKRGKDDMDVEAAEGDEGAEDGIRCAPCEPGAGQDDGDLNTMKGSSGAFQGYCSYCWT